MLDFCPKTQKKICGSSAVFSRPQNILFNGPTNGFSRKIWRHFVGFEKSLRGISVSNSSGALMPKQTPILLNSNSSPIHHKTGAVKKDELNYLLVSEDF